MKVFDIIHEQGDYKILYDSKVPVAASVTINGNQVSTGARHGFVFKLYKNDVFFKRYAVAALYPTPTQGIINSVIEVFKKFMV